MLTGPAKTRDGPGRNQRQRGNAMSSINHENAGGSFRRWHWRWTTGLGMLAAIVSMSIPPALGADVSFWDHNGSNMRIEQYGKDVTIAYEEPRSGIRKHGVSSGDTLFYGQVSPNGRLTGEAFVFRRGCEPESYSVSGHWNPDSGQHDLTLRGAAPIRERGGCDVVDYSNSSGSATLRFTLIGRDGHVGRTNDDEGQGYGSDGHSGRYNDNEGQDLGGSETIGHSPPGFDCAPYLRSGKCPEVAICRDPNLSYQDAMMGRLYNDLLRLAPSNRDRTQVRVDQKDNLRFRNECGCDVQCLENFYAMTNKSMGKTTVIWENQ